MFILMILHLQIAQKKAYFEFELTFDQHAYSICSKASKKLHALGRIVTFMSLEKRRTLMKAFIEFPIQLLSPSMDVSLKSNE